METKLEENKVCELLELREKLSEEIERSLEKERMTWLQEEEERFKEKVDAELAIAKMDWIKVNKMLHWTLLGCEWIFCLLTCWMNLIFFLSSESH